MCAVIGVHSVEKEAGKAYPPPSKLALLCFWKEDLTSAIGATVGAGVVREPGLFALRAQAQLW